MFNKITVSRENHEPRSIKVKLPKYPPLGKVVLLSCESLYILLRIYYLAINILRTIYMYVIGRAIARRPSSLNFYFYIYFSPSPDLALPGKSGSWEATGRRKESGRIFTSVSNDNRVSCCRKSPSSKLFVRARFENERGKKERRKVERH